jgi:hypothetical protein
MTRVSFLLYSKTPLQMRQRFDSNFDSSEEVRMDSDNDTVGGYTVPVDPMDFLQCDSCQ